MLPPDVAQQMTTVKAAEATYYPPHGQPAGWLLRNVETPFSQLTLTEEGAKLVRRMEKPSDLFVVSEVSFDLLHNRLESNSFVSTAELIRRLRSPAFGLSTVRLAQHLHARIVRPLANLLAALLAIPLILRKESRGLITNMAISAAVLTAMLGLSEVVAYGGKTGYITPELSAWIPILVTGPLFVWFTGIMQT